VNLGWMRQTLSVFYADSSGTSLLTSQGPVGVPVPGLVSSGIMPYSGKSYSAGYANSLIRHMIMTLIWSKFESTGTSTWLFSNVSSQTFSGSMTYTYRKINFVSSFTRAKQGASVTTAL